MYSVLTATGRPSLFLLAAKHVAYLPLRVRRIDAVKGRQVPPLPKKPPKSPLGVALPGLEPHLPSFLPMR